MNYKIIHGHCLDILASTLVPESIAMTFLDPPFNQQKEYTYHNDNMAETEYWTMMKQVCEAIFKRTMEGGAIYFMQREKNAEYVLHSLRNSGWTFQNLIIWKKKTSAVPVAGKYGKHYQIIVYATKGKKTKTFNKLRINPPLPQNYKFQRENGLLVTDIWDDIRELTSGYFAGNEAIRTAAGERFHKQQSPLALLLRMILTSTVQGDLILDPFAGTGTTLCVAQQLQRKSIGIEIDPKNVELIKNRLATIREADCIDVYYKDYSLTEHLAEIWGK